MSLNLLLMGAKNCKTSFLFLLLVQIPKIFQCMVKWVLLLNDALPLYSEFTVWRSNLFKTWWNMTQRCFTFQKLLENFVWLTSTSTKTNNLLIVILCFLNHLFIMYLCWTNIENSLKINFQFKVYNLKVCYISSNRLDIVKSWTYMVLLKKEQKHCLIPKLTTIFAQELFIF